MALQWAWLALLAAVFGSADRVAQFRRSLSSQLILAPLTRGGNLPFRRLVSDADILAPGQTGANMTTSEMAFARNLFQGGPRTTRKERALLKRHPSEKQFGFQIATKSAEEAIRSIALAEESGADWVDLNCGCPIFEATRRGLGAEMLKRPDSLARLVDLIVQGKGSDMPFTVKIRIGPSESRINVAKVVEGLALAGAAAITIHGRTMEQRYTRPADWSRISQVGGTAGVPIIGNGDILSPYEATDRLAMDGVTALMAGRGALIKPWLFSEYSAGSDSFVPTAEQRIGVYHRLALYFKDHFGSDPFGKHHSFYFLPWHFEFFCRYRPLPARLFHEASRTAPLIQSSRFIDDCLRLSADRDELFSQAPLEKLLRCENPEVHTVIAEHLWEAPTAEDAVALLQAFAVKADSAGQFARESREYPSLRPNTGAGKGESSWEVGGTGPRGVADERIEPAAADSAKPSPSLKQTKRPAANRWVPLPLKEHVAVLDFRVGAIVSSARHPTAENLDVHVVDLGEANGPRTIITGRQVDGSPSLQGDNSAMAVAVLCNLKPRTLLNVTSQGVILFAGGDGSGSWAPVCVAGGEPRPGSRLEFKGLTAPADQLQQFSPNRAQRAWKALEGALRTVNGVAVFSSPSPSPSVVAEDPTPLSLACSDGQPAASCRSTVLDGVIN